MGVDIKDLTIEGDIEYGLEKDQKVLENQYKMYEKTLKDTEVALKNKINKKTGKRVYTDAQIEKRLNQIKEARQDIIDKYCQNGGKAEDLVKAKQTTTRKKTAIDKTIKEKMEELRKTEEENKKMENVGTSTVKTVKIETPTMDFPKSGTNSAFDVIPLPSKGECYPEKTSRIPVAYLTAYDENIIVSPNLYRDNLVMDYILQQKIMNDDINPDYLLDGDRDAILLYLRSSGYGNEYPMTVTDDITGEEFDTVFDLSKLKFKDFTLKADERGFFDYTLPVSKKNLKFKFLNHKDNKDLDELNRMELRGTYQGRIMNIADELESYIDNVENVEPKEMVRARDAVRSIRDFGNAIPETSAEEYTHMLTNRLEMSIVEIDGNSDRRYIRDFVNNMNVRDSISLRKYINKNEPGIDYNIEIERPESLGGGSMKFFLELDQYLFLNVSE